MPSVAENLVKTGCLNPECPREKEELQQKLDATTLEYNNYKAAATGRENEHKENERKLTSERDAEKNRRMNTERDLVHARADLRVKDELNRKNVENARMDAELKHERERTKLLEEEKTRFLTDQAEFRDHPDPAPH